MDTKNIELFKLLIDEAKFAVTVKGKDETIKFLESKIQEYENKTDFNSGITQTYRLLVLAHIKGDILITFTQNILN